MAVKMGLGDAVAYRQAIEPLTQSMVSEDDGDVSSENVIAIASIAISLKRIADALEAANKQGAFKR